MVRSRETTDWFYRVLVSYLWMQLPQGSETLQKFVLLDTNPRAQQMLVELLSARLLSRKSRFAIQIAASTESGRLAGLVLTTVDVTARHLLLVRWEHMETLANAMSPESTVAPSTFVDVVLGGQLQMRSRTMLGTRELYLVLVENLGFLWTHLRDEGVGNRHVRKAYKYAMRSCGAYIRMTCTGQRSSNREDVGWDYMKRWDLHPMVDTPWLRKLPSGTSTLMDIQTNRITTALRCLMVSLVTFSRRFLQEL